MKKTIISTILAMMAILNVFATGSVSDNSIEGSQSGLTMQEIQDSFPKAVYFSDNLTKISAQNYFRAFEDPYVVYTDNKTVGTLDGVSEYKVSVYNNGALTASVIWGTSSDMIGGSWTEYTNGDKRLTNGTLSHIERSGYIVKKTATLTNISFFIDANGPDKITNINDYVAVVVLPNAQGQGGANDMCLRYYYKPSAGEAYYTNLSGDIHAAFLVSNNDWSFELS